MSHGLFCSKECMLKELSTSRRDRIFEISKYSVETIFKIYAADVENVTWPAKFSGFLSFLQLSWTVAESGLLQDFSVECFLTIGHKDSCLVVFFFAMVREFTLAASLRES